MKNKIKNLEVYFSERNRDWDSEYNLEIICLNLKKIWRVTRVY